ncbi:flagellar biosynthesis protein [Billgrantia tianxiuensis]|uniref:Flagellar biosynthesis protein n=1 Tax=Billgrantia tianxiuensis TaxID=2497861 RepID=A0A6I6SR28_9GAMM|nr:MULTISPECIES: flagellar biosynthesis protein [Halomonas]MCE8034142.1 flagellar biosynthesis protein [Halomonas sp. MCCC 1A11057]QHC51024.1 flagellar biosynthesis protein [Halomonas tianxiuensis]
MKLKSNAGLMAIFLMVFLAGCATNRSEIALAVPEVSSEQYIGAGQEVLIGEVVDRRIFEEAPREPSTPSLGSGGVSQASDEIKARAIGRKRNSYGKAMGDILLEEGQSVEEVVRSSLTLALQEAGYNVLAEPAGPGVDAPIIDVYINEFWAWFSPGFWAITLNTRISTDLELREGSAQEVVAIHAQQSRQVATEAAWVEIVEKALDDYRSEALMSVPRLF